MPIKLAKKDIIWGYFAQFFSIASGMLILPFVLNMLKPNEIGMNYLMLTIGSMVALFDFGFAPQFGRNITYIYSGAQILKKEGIEVNQQDNPVINYRLLATIIHTAKSVYGIISLIVLSVMLAFGTLYIYKITNGFVSVNNSLIIWIVYSFSTFFNIYYTYFSSLLTGSGMIMESKKAMVFSRIAYLIVAGILLKLGIGLLAIAIANLITPFISRFLSSRYYFTKDLKEKINIYTITKAEKVNLFSILWYNSKKIGLVYIGSYAITKLGIFLAGLYLPLNDIASYGLMIQFVTIISTISGTLFVISEPRLSALKIEGDKKSLLNNFAFCMGIYYLLFIVLSIGFLVVAPLLLTLIKSNIALPSITILVLYLIVMLLELNHSFFATMIVIGNKVPFVGISLFTGALIILGSYFSLVFTDWGILGLVLVQGFVQLAYSNWKWPLIICKEFKINFIHFLKIAFTEVYKKQKLYFYGG